MRVYFLVIDRKNKIKLKRPFKIETLTIHHSLISRAGTFTGTSSNLLVAGFWSLVAGTSLVPVTGTSYQRF